MGGYPPKLPAISRLLTSKKAQELRLLITQQNWELIFQVGDYYLDSSLSIL